MTKDLLVQVCVYCEYPIWRQWLTKYRSKFNKVILFPSRHHGVVDFEPFLREQIQETWINDYVIDWTTPGIDWRQAEVEPCLEKSDADWIWFAEQDFFTPDWDQFFTDIEKSMQTSDMIGYWNNTHFPYVHPCCLLIKREFLDKTQKDFCAHPEIPGCDHFAMLTRDAKRLGAKIAKIQDMNYFEWGNMCHLGGLTYPYQNFAGDKTVFGLKNVEMFYVYNYYSRKAPVVQSPEYIDLSLKVEEVLKKEYGGIDLENNEWTKFFKI